MKTELGNRLCREIRSCAGLSDALEAGELARRVRLGVNGEREIHAAIRAESCLWDFVVCTAPGGDYFRAETFTELETYPNWLLELRDQVPGAVRDLRETAARHGYGLSEARPRAERCFVPDGAPSRTLVPHSP